MSFHDVALVALSLLVFELEQSSLVSMAPDSPSRGPGLAEVPQGSRSGALKPDPYPMLVNNFASP